MLSLSIAVYSEQLKLSAVESLHPFDGLALLYQFISIRWTRIKMIRASVLSEEKIILDINMSWWVTLLE